VKLWLSTASPPQRRKWAEIGSPSGKKCRSEMNNCKNYSDEKSVFWKIFQLRDNKLFNTTIGIFYEYFRLSNSSNKYHRQMIVKTWFYKVADRTFWGYNG